jgi:hypothetical protein
MSEETATSETSEETTDTAVDTEKTAKEESTDVKSDGEHAKEEAEPSGEKDEKRGEFKDLKLPKGVVADEAWMKRFTEHDSVKELTQSGAESLLGLLSEYQNETAETTAKYWADTSKEWATEFEAHELTKKLGSKETQALAAAARETFFPEIGKVLEENGMAAFGNHPVFAVGLARIAQQFNLLQATPKGGSAPSGERKQDAASRWYPTMKRGGSGADAA